MSKSELEILFDALCKDDGLPPFVREHRFHPTRKWRLDFAWPDQKIGVEINGSQHRKGGHNTGKGVAEDAEKGNAARFLGWRIFVLWTDQLKKDVGYRNQFMAELNAALSPPTLTIVPERMSLTSGKFTLVETGLQIASTPTFEEFETFGEALKFFDKSIPWALGDWWNAAKSKFRDDALQLLDEHDVKLKSVQNKAAIAKKFPKSRRRENLHFSHHEAVAGLDEPHQERFLDDAGSRGWTVPQLRLAVRSWKQDKNDARVFDDPPGAVQLALAQIAGGMADLWSVADYYPLKAHLTLIGAQLHDIHGIIKATDEADGVGGIAA